MEPRDRLRGIVIELTGRTAVLLAPDGTFHAVRRVEGWQVGDEVVARQAQRAAPAAWWGLGGASAAVAAGLAFFLAVVPAQARPVAYVNVYGQTTVTLAVGASGQVVGIDARSGKIPGGVRPGVSAAQAVDILTRVEGGPVQPGAPTGVMVAMYTPKGEAHPPTYLALKLAEVARRNAALFEALPGSTAGERAVRKTGGRPGGAAGALARQAPAGAESET